MPEPKDHNAMPEGLSADGQRAHEVIMGVLQRFDMTYTGGCTSFYSPAQWKERGEDYCCESLLIVVYDGGDLSSFFSYIHGTTKLQEAMEIALGEAGFYIEPGTHWYSGIYKS